MGPSFKSARHRRCKDSRQTVWSGGYQTFGFACLALAKWQRPVKSLRARFKCHTMASKVANICGSNRGSQSLVIGDQIVRICSFLCFFRAFACLLACGTWIVSCFVLLGFTEFQGRKRHRQSAWAARTVVQTVWLSGYQTFGFACLAFSQVAAPG
jgi:hypothetical protein